jgi:hypothetical protein
MSETAVTTTRKSKRRKKRAPDPTVVYMTSVKRIVIRAIKTYLSTLIGVLGYGVVGEVIPTLPLADFTQNFLMAASISVAPTVANILLNTLIFVTKLDESLPESVG